MVAFTQEPEPPRGVALEVAPGIRRIVAPNPGAMTYHGTNTYLIEDEQGDISVLDPGPDDAAHIDAVVAAGDGRIRRILVSHTHADHFAGAASLRARTGASLFGWHTSADPDFTADHGLRNDDQVAGLTALHTPGHAADHICFEWRDGIVFTADHVMGWATSVVFPPQGDMRAYMASLELLLPRPHRLYLCGHGPAVINPHAYVRGLLAHRIHRERAIAQAVHRAPFDTASLVRRLYASLNPVLRAAAERNVTAHLLKLQQDGKVTQHGPLWHWVGASPHTNPQ